MKIAIAVLILLFLYVACELGAFWYRTAHLPLLMQPDQSEKTLGTRAPLRYIAAGDSTAVGIGASSLQATYTYQIAEFFAKNNTVDYKNVAVVGAKTGDILATQVQQIIDYKPDVITISMGGNDATHLVPSADVLENYKTIIQKLESKTSASIYITDIPNFNGASLLPWFFIDLIQFRAKSQDSAILSLQDDRVKIVDIHNFGWDLAPYNDRSKTYAADNFHPNDLGYQNWVNAFLSKIK